MLNENRPRLQIRLCACLVFTFSLPLFGQFRAAIQGSIKDTTGAVIPNAKIKLTNNETRKTQETTSSSEGFYRFSGLPPGSYNIEASAAGMKVGLVQNIIVAAESTQGVDITLEPGAVAETVTVTSEATPALLFFNDTATTE